MTSISKSPQTSKPIIGVSKAPSKDKPVGSPSNKSSAGIPPVEGEREGQNFIPEDGRYGPQNRFQNYANRAGRGVYENYGEDLGKEGRAVSFGSGTQQSEMGALAGLESAEDVYGITRPELGYETQDIQARRRARMDGSSPEGTNLRESRNRRVRMANAAGRNPAQVEQIKREAESDIATAGYAREGQALTDYQGLMGKMISGTLQQQYQHMGLAISGKTQEAAAPQGGGGTVICTELFKQGYMDHETYELDKQYGAVVRATRPHVYIGYRLLADPVVVLMQKSKLFCSLLSIPALCWAEYMSGKKNLIGAVIYKVGEAVCGVIGKLKGMRYEER